MKSFITRVLALALASAGLPLIGGCSAFGGGDDHHDYRGGSASRYDSRYDSRDSRDAAQQAGDRNTRISDKVDDGRINGSARSYEERKASRAADEGVPGARREERELRNERLDRN